LGGQRSTDDLHLSGVADHDELAATLDQMKTAATDFTDKGGLADFAVYVPDRSANYSAVCDRFGGEDIVKPSLSENWGGRQHLHAANSAQAGLRPG
jgi:hypothetical protein